MENPMSNELSAKVQVALWWITSIAVSVLCCSVLFVVFASHLGEVKASVRDNNERIVIIQEREDRILAELDMMRRHMVYQPTPAAEPAAPDAAAAPEVPAPTPGGPLPTNPPEKETAPGAAIPSAQPQPLPTPAPVPAPAPAPTPAAPVPAPAAQ